MVPFPTVSVMVEPNWVARAAFVKLARPGPTMVSWEAAPVTVPTKLVSRAWLTVTAPPVSKSRRERAEPLTPAMDVWPF